VIGYPIRARAGRAAEPRATGMSWLWWLVEMTVAAAAAELLVLRLFTRTIIHIPGAQSVSPVWSVIATSGRFAYYLASVLLVATLVLLLRELARRTSQRAMVGAATVTIFVAAGASARTGVVSDLWLALVVSTSVLVLAFFAREAFGGIGWLGIVLFAGGFTLSSLHTVLQSSAFSDLRRPGSTTGLLGAGEALALAGALLAPALLRGRHDRRAALVGIGAALSTFLMLLANTATTKILLLWNFGLAGYFPTVVYAAAFGALVYTVVALARAGDRERALALALLVIGGIGLHSTYQGGLVVAGLALLGLTGRGGAILSSRS